MSNKSRKALLAVLLGAALTGLGAVSVFAGKMDAYKSFTDNRIFQDGAIVSVSGTAGSNSVSKYTNITVHGRKLISFRQGCWSASVPQPISYSTTEKQVVTDSDGNPVTDAAGNTQTQTVSVTKTIDGKVREDSLGQHGCIESAMTTILRSYVPGCAGWTPFDVIDIAEKRVAGNAAWLENYTKSAANQRPMTMLTADRILSTYGVKHQRVYNTDYAAAKKDIISTLKENGQIMFTVNLLGSHGVKTTEEQNPYTNSYHTMLMIGYREDGKVLVLNSGNGNQLVALNLDDVMSYMWFSSHPGTMTFLKTTETISGKKYSWNIPSDAGYIKLTGDVRPCCYTDRSIKVATTKADGAVYRHCTRCDNDYVYVVPRIRSFGLKSTSLKATGKKVTPQILVKGYDGKAINNGFFTVKITGASKKPGTYKVKITGKGYYEGSKTIKYKVVKGTQSIKASNKTVTFKKNGTVSLGVSRTGTGKLTYSSGNKSRATVNAKGVVTMKKRGKVTITIKAKSNTYFKSATRKITLQMI